MFTPLLVKLILLPFLASFFLVFFLTPLGIKIAWKLKLVDDPATRKHPAHLHQKTIPRAGGLPIFVGVLLAALIFLPFDQHLRGILAGGLVLVVLGLLDDRYDLNPYLRLIACFAAAGCVVIAGIGIAYITNPLGGIIKLDQPQIAFKLFGEERHLWLLADLFALFWIVFMTNIMNWSKGFDGQLPGIVTIAALTIALLSLKFSADVTQWQVAILAAITAGSFLGFLPFNFFPQKIMPGYSGGALAGFLLATLAILSTTKVGTALVVLGVPFIDALYSITRRILAGRSPVWGDRGHLHHKLIDEWRWGKRKTAIFYWTITATLGILALSLPSWGKFYTIILLAVIIGGLLLWFNFSKALRDPLGPDKPSKT